MESKTILVLSVILALVIGLVIGYIATPEKEVEVIKEVLKNCDPCTPEVRVIEQECPEVPVEVDVDCDCEPCIYTSEDAGKSNIELKEEISEEYDKRAFIMQISRNCDKWIKSEQDKGNIDEDVTSAPLCWEKDGRQERLIARLLPLDSGCKLVYVLGC